MINWRSTLRNAGWLISDRVVRLVLNFIAGITIARALGPADFGLLNYGQALIFLVTPLATAGLPEIVVRELSRGTARESLSERQRIVANAMVIRAISAVAAIVVMSIIAFVTSPDDLTAKLVIIAYSLAMAPQTFDVIESALQAEGSFKSISIARTANSIIFAIIKIVAAIFGVDVIWFALLYTLEICIFCIFYIIIAKRNNIFPKFIHIELSRIRFLLSSSYLLMLRLFSIAVYMRIDQIMVKEILGTSALGVYSVATRISELWYFVPTALMSAALPRLTRAFELGLDVYEVELRRWLRLMLIIAIPVAAAISLTAPFIVETLFGAAYSPAAPVLAVQAWAGVFVAIGVASSPWFINTGHMRYGLYHTAIGAVASVGLNFILIPTIGLLGASLSMVFSYALSSVFCNVMFRETRPLLKQQLKAFTSA
jgi:PST family polysaccharide transporter